MKKCYVRVEITVANDNEIEVDSYKFLMDKSKFLENARYIKTLLYDEINKTTPK